MRATFIVLMLAGAFGMLAAVPAVSQDPAPPAGDPESGKRLYNDHGCYQCHNYDAAGGAASRLAPDPIPYSAFSRYVRIPTGQMPPYTTSVLPDQALADIYAFLETVPEPPSVESIPQLND